MPLAEWIPLRKAWASTAGPSPPALWHSRQLSAPAGSLASSAFAANARSTERRAIRERIIEVPGGVEARGRLVAGMRADDLPHPHQGGLIYLARARSGHPGAAANCRIRRENGSDVGVTPTHG